MSASSRDDRAAQGGDSCPAGYRRILFAAVSKRTNTRLRGRWRRRRDALVPPRSVDPAGGAEFVAAGDAFFHHVVTLAGLLPDDRVLEIGSGTGRVARPLARFLSGDGSYDGFDVNADAIAWCQEHYASFPNVRFQRPDLFNTRYHPDGAQQASEFTFPYADAGFDCVLAPAVLTHLVTAEAERYLRETARVLVPGGRAVITLFLLDLGSRAAITQGRATLPFDLEAAAGPMVVVDPELPEEAVAFDHLWLDEVFTSSGLRRIDAHPGGWRGTPGLAYQDLVVLESAA